MNDRKILDTYWPVIEQARKVKAYYMGEIKGEPKRICSDVVGELIKATIKANNDLPVEREEV